MLDSYSYLFIKHKTMNSFESFKNITFHTLNQSFKSENNLGGWGVNTDEPITVTNTVEALLTFQTLNSNFASLTQDQLNKIIIYLTTRFEEISHQSISDIRTREVAYCGLGLHLLGNNTITEKVLDLLNSGKCTNGGWGITLDKKNPNLLATFQASQLFHTLNQTLTIPQWFFQTFREGGCSFSPSSVIRDKISFPATAMVNFMLTHFYQPSTNEQFLSVFESTKNIISRHFEEIVRKIVSNNQDYIACEERSGFHIFGFGLAAQSLKRQGVHLINEYDLRDYFRDLKDDYFNLHSKHVPFILENARLIEAVRSSYDPFLYTRDSSIEILNNEINELYDKLEEKREEEIKQNFSVINIAIIYNLVKFMVSALICIILAITITSDINPLGYLLIFLIVSLSDFIGSIRRIYSFLTRLVISITKGTSTEQMNIFNKITDRTHEEVPRVPE